MGCGQRVRPGLRSFLLRRRGQLWIPNDPPEKYVRNVSKACAESPYRVFALHPNFWSFFDSTPTGVTIHEIDEGIDTGPIVFQKKVVFSPNEDTFAKTHRRLIMEIEDLFIQNMGALLSGNYQARPQVGPGTYHATKDLPKSLDDWNSKIQDTIMRLKEGIE